MTSPDSTQLLATFRRLLLAADRGSLCAGPLVSRFPNGKFVAWGRQNTLVLIDPEEWAGVTKQVVSEAFGRQRKLGPTEVLLLNAAVDRESLALSGHALASMSETVGALPLTKGYDEAIEDSVRSDALAAIGRAKLSDLDPDFTRTLAISDFWRAGAGGLLKELGLSGTAQIETVPLLIAQALLDESRENASILLDKVGDEVFAAADCLALCPSHEIAPHVMRYYLEAEEQGTLARRRQAAELYPTFAGLIANIGTISRAVDKGQPISDLLAVAVQCQDRKKLFRRIQGEKNLLARQLLMTGALDDIPLDWLPQSSADWKALKDIEGFWRRVLPGDSHVAAPLWNLNLFVGSKGKFADVATRIVKEASDRRPPDGTGEAAAAHFKATLNTKPIGSNADVVDQIFARTEAAFQGLGEATLAEAGWPTEAAVANWLRRVCVQYGDADELQGASEGLRSLVHVLATRVLLPTAMMAERAIAAPVTRSLLKEAEEAAARVLLSGKSITSIAGMGRQFVNHAAELSRPLVSEAEVKAKQEKERATASWRRISVSNDTMRWMEFFGIEGDPEECPPLTVIQEFAPGLIAVPLFNRRQLLEEGDFGHLGALDRRGVPNLSHCIGSNHAADYILSEGLRQAFSVRRVVGDSYTREFTVAIRLEMKDGKPTVRAEEAKRLANARLSATDSAQVDRFLTKLVTQNLINPKLIQKLNELSARGSKPKEAQAPIETIIGYTPFPVYKTAAALKRWQASGLLPAGWRDLNVGQVGEAQEVIAVRNKIREAIALRTGMTLERPLTTPVPAAKPGAKPKSFVVQPGERGRISGLFTGSTSGPTAPDDGYSVG
jgi:hypothetical protein